MLDFSPDREVEENDYDWYANPIVETTFEVERLARLGRHRFVRYHWCSERGIGRRQQCREQRSCDEIQRGKQRHGGQKPKHNHESGQADQQQPLRQTNITANHAKVGVRRIRKQNHRQRGFRNYLQIGGCDVNWPIIEA